MVIYEQVKLVVNCYLVMKYYILVKSNANISCYIFVVKYHLLLIHQTCVLFWNNVKYIFYYLGTNKIFVYTIMYNHVMDIRETNHNNIPQQMIRKFQHYMKQVKNVFWLNYGVHQIQGIFGFSSRKDSCNDSTGSNIACTSILKKKNKKSF